MTRGKMFLMVSIVCLFAAAGIPLQTANSQVYTHTVLVEEGTATWCPYCPGVAQYLAQIYESGSYDFYYVALVQDMNTYANSRLQQLGITGYPTCFGDGGVYSVVGNWGSTGPYISMINNCGSRTVADIDLAVSADWLGNAQIDIAVDVTNNYFMPYNGRLRVYVTEIESRWYVFGTQYHYAMIGDFAINQDVSIGGGSTEQFTTTWNGNSYGFGDIDPANIKVIAAIFDASQDWVDETAAANVSTGPGDVIVELTYVSGSPVPANGGNIYFDVYVENQGTVPVNFDAWLDIEYEGGAPTTVVQRSFTNYQPGWTINRPNMFFPIPGSYAAGNYMMYGRVGNHPNDVWDESGFPFVKSGVNDGSAFTPFIPDGVINPFDEIDTGEASVSLPSEYTVGAYPNPFNPTTTLNYALPEAGDVHMTVYDVNGRQVAELVNGWREAGIHEVTFDASDLPSGVYIYRLETGDFSSSGKMILMK